jgi:hypothetical protein
VGPENGPAYDKPGVEYSILLRRFASSDQAKRFLAEPPAAPRGEHTAPPVEFTMHERSREVKATLVVSRLVTPATKHLPESWSPGSCRYAWLLDDRTVVKLALDLWPAAGVRPAPPPRASEMSRAASEAAGPGSRPQGRPMWAGWTNAQYIQRTSAFLATVMRVLDEELHPGRPN